MPALPRLATYFLVGSGVGGGGVYMLRPRPQAESTPSMTSTDFNALQNQPMLRDALRPQQLPWSFPERIKRDATLDPFATTTAQDGYVLTLFRLLGCPFCAKVEALLRFHGVPYKEVQVNPITGAGLPDKRYELAPQLYLLPRKQSEAAAGVFVVDSGTIIESLAPTLGYTKDLADRRVTETRDWIANHFQAASFIITNSSIRNAYATYTYVTPVEYSNMFYHLIGSVALCALANWKLKPKLLAKPPHPLTLAAKEECSETPSHPTTETWLEDELKAFQHNVAKSKGGVFHGGAKPDLADVELFGVMQVVSSHPYLGEVVRRGESGQWLAAMEAEMMKRKVR